MFKKLAAFAAVILSFAVMASTAQAGTDTGWYCANPGQLVNAGGGYAYLCRTVTHTWWVIQL